jgi:Cutinase
MMKSPIPALFIFPFAGITLASPVAPLAPRASTTSAAVATLTAGATIPTSTIQSAVAGCAAINLAGATRNDITSGQPCKEFTLIFARGTTESGNIGDIVGPPFVNALNGLLGASNVAVQGVNNYPADIPGFLAGGSATGSADMAAVSLRLDAERITLMMVLS